ncbi:MAG: glycosyltransferase [Firmicutes bacterium]|nr:glycosyltransferase [Bacillota bacterium]
MSIRRVLVVSLHADPLTYGDSGAVGGQQVLIRELVKNVQQHGYGIDVLTAQSNPLWPNKFSLGHLGQVIRLAPGLDKAREHEWFRDVEALADQALAWIEESGRRYDVIHSHYWISGLVAERLHRRLGIPWVHSPVKMAEWTERSEESVDDERVTVERQLLEKADAAVVAYLREADRIHQLKRALPVYVIPPGVDPTQFFTRDAGPVLRAHQVARRPVIYVGRLELARGLRDALKVLARRPLPNDFALFVVGGTRREVEHGRPISPHLAALADQLGPRVHFVGGMPHRGVAPYLAASAVMIAPNQGPTLGMAVLESLACGVPVVGTRVTGIQDWVEEDRDGYLVNPPDMEDLWDYALALWDDPMKARRMGYAGQSKVHRLHTTQNMAAQMVACYREVTGLGRNQMGIGV